MSNRTSSALLLATLASLAVSMPVVGQEPLDPHSAPVQPEIREGRDYRVYDRNGDRSSLEALVMASLGDEVLLVGEEHDDMIGHAFQTALLDLVVDRIGSPSGAGRDVVLSLEMFERDVQYIVDEYLAGEISEDHFLRSSRPWPDYEGRYRPAVEVAREEGVPIVAANAPRRYVSRVTSLGPESLLELSAQARTYLPPLPYPGPSTAYRAQWDALMTAAMLGMEAPAEDDAADEAGDTDPGADHRAGSEEEGEESEAVEPARYEMNPNAIYSQALWDASMGHAVTEALVRHIGGFVIHFAGSFHVAEETGIPERIRDYRPGTRMTSVVMTKVDDIDAWSAEEHGILADWVVLTRKPDSEE